MKFIKFSTFIQLIGMIIYFQIILKSKNFLNFHVRKFTSIWLHGKIPGNFSKAKKLPLHVSDRS